MPYEKVGNIRLDKSKKVVVVTFNDGESSLFAPVSSLQEVLDGKPTTANVSRNVIQKRVPDVVPENES